MERTWHFIDATDKVLGRLSTQVAKLLQGKHKPQYIPNQDCGDFVEITNAGKIRVTGKKADQKIYFSHSMYPGGDKYTSYKELFGKSPARVIYLSVSGMLPKNKLRKRFLKRLKIYKEGKTN
ncbi:MAG: 50S ribosomal protein L13 [Elusimicrobiota bacterium]